MIEAQQIVSKPGSVLEAVLKGPQLPPSPAMTESLRSIKSEKSPEISPRVCHPPFLVGRGGIKFVFAFQARSQC